jgi:hypothetical protein
MKNFVTFLESTKVNKFNIGWQAARTSARSIKDVNEKIKFVLGFLDSHPNKHNYERVMNWVKMTGVAYPDKSESRNAFLNAEHQLKDNIQNYSNIDDDPNDISEVHTDVLRMVLDDLKRRKYGFQYKQTPKAHIEFVNQLEQELAHREK